MLAKDRAGNESVSPIVRVPPDGATGVGFPKTGARRRAPEWVGGGAGSSNLPQARIDYVNTLKFDVDYTVEQMGRSGVKAAHLFVPKNQGNWTLVEASSPVEAHAGRQGPDRCRSRTRRSEEGTYGFYVIPESGAGKRADDPNAATRRCCTSWWTRPRPYVQITGVQVRPGGARGPLVEITWEAADPNLMPEPISLEWSLDAKAGEVERDQVPAEQHAGRPRDGTRGKCRTRTCGSSTSVRGRWIRPRTPANTSGARTRTEEPARRGDRRSGRPRGGINGVRGGNTPPGSGSPHPPGGSDDPPAGGSEPAGFGPDLPILPKVP